MKKLIVIIAFCLCSFSNFASGFEVKKEELTIMSQSEDKAYALVHAEIAEHLKDAARTHLETLDRANQYYLYYIRIGDTKNAQAAYNEMLRLSKLFLIIFRV